MSPRSMRVLTFGSPYFQSTDDLQSVDIAQLCFFSRVARCARQSRLQLEQRGLLAQLTLQALAIQIRLDGFKNFSRDLRVRAPPRLASIGVVVSTAALRVLPSEREVNVVHG